MAAKIIVGGDVCLWANEPAGGVWILSGYCKAFVELLKERVPWRDRAWDKESSAWWLSDKWADWTLGCAELLYVQFEQRQINELFSPLPETPRAHMKRLRDTVFFGPASQTEAWAWRILWLRVGAPARMVTAAKRALALHYHPDRHPDAGWRMVEINQAAAILETTLREKGLWPD